MLLVIMLCYAIILNFIRMTFLYCLTAFTFFVIYFKIISFADNQRTDINGYAD